MTTLLTRIRDHCAEHKMSETAFGREAMNDPGFVGALRKGRRVTPRTLAKVETFLDGATEGGASAKPRIPAAVIRAAKVDGRDLGAFVSALILMGLDCWRDDRVMHREPVE